MEANILTSINGTKHAGSYVEGMDSTVLEVLQILDGVNDPSVQNDNVKGLKDLNPFITTLKGKNGHKQSFKERKIRAIDDGEFQDAPTFGEKYEQWYFTMDAGLVLKDVNFTNKMIMQAEMDSVSLEQIIMDRAKDVASWYVNKFIPYSWYSCLMTLPTAQESATYRSAPIGLLKNTVVDKDMLMPNVTRTTRNHYKGIKDTTAGITVEDLERWVLEMTEYRTISDNNIVVYGTRGTISRVRSTINADINKDIFNRTGKPSDVILGVQFIENDMIKAC